MSENVIHISWRLRRDVQATSPTSLNERCAYRSGAFDRGVGLTVVISLLPEVLSLVSMYTLFEYYFINCTDRLPSDESTVNRNDRRPI